MLDEDGRFGREIERSSFSRFLEGRLEGLQGGPDAIRDANVEPALGGLVEVVGLTKRPAQRGKSQLTRGGTSLLSQEWQVKFNGIAHDQVHLLPP